MQVLKPVVVTEGQTIGTEQAAITWTNDFDQALEQAREKQRHVLLDFTAAPM